MSVTCVVQARMASTRLPGKVLADLGGRPLLAFMLERLAPLPVDHLVVATTGTAADDPVAALAEGMGVALVRGPEHDVLGRFLAALDAFPADTVVRLTADCPLADPEVVVEAIGVRERTGAHYASNTLVRTFPDGLDVEVLTAGALREAAAQSTDPTEREHVTPFVYRRPERFGLATVRTDALLGDERWTVDTAEDLAAVRSMVARLGPPTSFTWRDVAELVGSRNPPAPGQLHLRPAVAGDEELLLAWRNDTDAVAFSRTQAAVDPAAHHQWLARHLTDPSSRIWVGMVDGRPVGQVRVDVRDGVGLVSIAVDPAARGRGLGTALLVALQRALRADHQVRELHAHIHPANQASLGAFARAGFVPAGQAEGFAHYRWPG